MCLDSDLAYTTTLLWIKLAGNHVICCPAEFDCHCVLRCNIFRSEALKVTAGCEADIAGTTQVRLCLWFWMCSDSHFAYTTTLLWFWMCSDSDLAYKTILLWIKLAGNHAVDHMCSSWCWLSVFCHATCHSEMTKWQLDAKQAQCKIDCVSDFGCARILIWLILPLCSESSLLAIML